MDDFENINLYSYFSSDEIFELWRLKNIYWYIHWANAPQNGNRMPFIERALLRDMIEKADNAIATGENKRAQLQHTLMQAAAAHEHVEQVHGFYYFEDEHRVSIDVVPDITIHDDGAFIQELVNELQPLVPDDKVSIVIDHNYSE